MSSFIEYLQHLSPALICLVTFSFAFVENVFPPTPSDLAIVFAGSLIAIGNVSFAAVLLSSTSGSVLGFIAMYKIGEWFGERILAQGRITFIPQESVRKVDAWFRQYGYRVIIANRFLAGTRAVVSFFAGMAELHLTRTTMLCALSALAWNSVLLVAGYSLGNNWQRIGFYLSAYSQGVTAVVVIAAIILIARYLYRRSNGANARG
ncbi:MAG TPA: DedA family protein [Bacteroidota bacterium]|nr:DedA family protein [Bacteroidota bacterium]